MNGASWWNTFRESLSGLKDMSRPPTLFPGYAKHPTIILVLYIQKVLLQPNWVRNLGRVQVLAVVTRCFVD